MLRLRGLQEQLRQGRRPVRGDGPPGADLHCLLGEAAGEGTEARQEEQREEDEAHPEVRHLQGRVERQLYHAGRARQGLPSALLQVLQVQEAARGRQVRHCGQQGGLPLVCCGQALGEVHRMQEAHHGEDRRCSEQELAPRVPELHALQAADRQLRQGVQARQAALLPALRGDSLQLQAAEEGEQEDQARRGPLRIARDAAFGGHRDRLLPALPRHRVLRREPPLLPRRAPVQGPAVGPRPRDLQQEHCLQVPHSRRRARAQPQR
mmetsp:Transcript_1746/g.6223  ORF Transcript_1746/g.6223 Transcript_1746/m.6223 type:complete len:265 (-) Transcript_1746:283-1077(-)